MLNNCALNIDQNNHYYDLCNNQGALLPHLGIELTTTGKEGRRSLTRFITLIKRLIARHLRPPVGRILTTQKPRKLYFIFLLNNI